jgi:hypothetical protein
MPEERRRTPITLTTGSILSIRSADKGEEPLVSRGTFRGYVSLGGDQAISIELEGTEEKSKDEGNGMKGKIRLIPCATVLSLDIITSAKPEEEKKSPESRPVYFG